MNDTQLPEAVWRKSSYSGEGGNECVEVAILGDGAAVRDSKDPQGGYFTVPEAAYSAFLAAVK
ncbi:DUF397 domain-containing protein [Amycolatopsis vancoresmycina]|uniref:DUF397 domain-containing protein n=1 Tax=Amycolatopsis vancoresmycina DSM 44592 TaxID=1292037 RepID=R1GBD2_9PSEU|nr:DUF397 domain-containing protein [Amycolatopsis vancoresmycina]EOD68643.1 hypothetical protein H480_10235 [Amycolatopsis vancoresmycina DSM 44592]